MNDERCDRDRVARNGERISTEELRAVEFYNPQANDYELAKDPRCLWGWAPRPNEMFGHGCFLPFGHDGKCRDDDARSQRPKDWDESGRAEANR